MAWKSSYVGFRLERSVGVAMKNKAYLNYFNWSRKSKSKDLPLMERTTKSGKQSDINYLTPDFFDDPEDEFWSAYIAQNQKVEKHLSGKHDQKTHTPRIYESKTGIMVSDSDTPDASALNKIKRANPQGVSALRTEIAKTAEAVFNAKFFMRNGTEEVLISTEVQSVKLVSRNPSGVRFVVTGTVTREGREVGEFRRIVDTSDSSVYNASFKISKEFQGKGIGTAIMAHWEDQFARIGIKKMEVTALTSGSQYNGAYTWAVYGYRPTKASVTKVMSQYISFLTHGGRHNKETWGAYENIIKRYNLPEGSSDEIVAKAIVAEFKGSLLKPMAEFPMLKGLVSGQIYSPYIEDIEWSGSKKPRIINKASESEIEIVDRWMRTRPQELENDSEEFWEEIRNAPEEVEKHQPNKHNQKKHASKKKASTPKPAPTKKQAPKKSPAKPRVKTTNEIGIAGTKDLSIEEYKELVLKQNEKVNATFDSSEKWAFEHYFGENYGGINQVMRVGARVGSDGKINRYDEIMLDYVTSMKAGYSKAQVELPRDTVLYRGLRMPKEESFSVGDVIEDRAFTSTTTNSDRAYRFAGTGEGDRRPLTKGDKSVVIVVKAPKGLKVMVGGNLAPFYEEEMLLQPSTKMKVVGVEKISDPSYRVRTEKIIVELV